MKRFLSALLAFSMVFSILVLPAGAADTPSMEIKSSQTTLVESGSSQKVTLSVMLYNPDPVASDIAGVSFKLASDSEKLVLATDALTLTDAFGAGSSTYYSPAFTALKLEGLYAKPITATEVTLITIEATLAADAPVGSYTISTAEMSVSDTKAVGVFNADVSVTINVVEKLSAIALTGGITTPGKGGADASALAGDNVEVAIAWSPALEGGKFAASTAYTAKVTVSPKAGYAFGADTKVSAEGLTFARSGDVFVAQKTFPATDSRAVIGLVVTAPPTKLTYADGDSFDPAGMVVQATYDEGEADTDFKGYSITYSSGSALRKGDTKVVLKAGAASVEVAGLTVSGKVPGAALFSFAAPGLTYSGDDCAAAVEAAVICAGTVETRGAVSYSFKQGETVVTEVINAGDYTLYAALAGGSEYEAATDIKVAEFTVAAKALVEADFTVDTADQEYAADQIKPSVAATGGLVPGTDYKVTFGANRAVGTGTVLIEGTGNYSGSISKSFAITKKPLAMGAAVESRAYSGGTDAVINAGDLSGLLGSDAVGISPAFVAGTFADPCAGTGKAVTAAGTFGLSGSAAGNYTLVQPTGLTGDITAALQKLSSDYSSAESPYTLARGSWVELTALVSGAAGTLTFTVDTELAELDGAVLTAGDTPDETPIEVTATAAEYDVNGDGVPEFAEAGSIALYIRIVDKGIGSFDVTQANGSFGSSLPAPRYTRPAGAGEVTALYSGTLRSGSAYSSAEAPTEAGSYTLTLSCESADTVYTATADFEIAPRDIDGAVVTLGTALTYSGELQTQAVAGVAVAGLSLADSDYTVEDNTGTDAGSYRLTVLAGDKSNYTGFVEKDFAIARKTLEGGPAVAVVDGPHSYTGSAIEPAFTVKDGGTELPADEYTAAVSDNVNAGEGKITVTAAAGGNYSWSPAKVQGFAIGKAAYLGSAAGEATAKVGAAGSFDLAGLGLPAGFVLGTAAIESDADGALAEVPTVSGTVLHFRFAEGADKVGSAAAIRVPVTAADNYLPFDLVITVFVSDRQAQSDFKFAAAEQAKTYGDDDFTLAATGAVEGSSVTYVSSAPTVATVDDSGRVHILKAGTAVITATAAAVGEYDSATASCTLTVGRAELVVRPRSESIYRNSALPAFVLEYVGLKNGDVGAEVARLAGGTLEMQARNAADDGALAGTGTNGTYKIVFSASPVFAPSDRYSIAAGEGQLTISSRPGGGGGLILPSSPSGLPSGSNTQTVGDSEVPLTDPDAVVPDEEGWVNPFTDVAESAWYYADVEYVVTKGLFAGTTATTFSPDGAMTRGMLVTVLGRMEAINTAAYATPSFDDTPAGAYYTPYVSWAAQMGIVEGYNEGSFGPDDKVTREQLATILWRYAKLKGIDVSVGEETDILGYHDAAKVSDYAVEALRWAIGAGVVTGRPGELLDPQGSATRAEAAAMLHRFLEK